MYVAIISVLQNTLVGNKFIFAPDNFKLPDVDPVWKAFAKNVTGITVPFITLAVTMALALAWVIYCPTVASVPSAVIVEVVLTIQTLALTPSITMLPPSALNVPELYLTGILTASLMFAVTVALPV